MNISKATGKLKEQIHIFSGRLSADLPKVAGRFVEEALFGIQAHQSVRLSEWGRALHDKTSSATSSSKISPHEHVRFITGFRPLLLTFISLPHLGQLPTVTRATMFILHRIWRACPSPGKAVLHSLHIDQRV